MVKKLLNLFLITLTGVGTGCQSLPNVSKMIADVPDLNEPPKIISAERPLSADESRVFIDKLQLSAGTANILTRNLEVMNWWTQQPLTSDNKVVLLVDGVATYAAMFKAVENARDHINVETFYFSNDMMGSRFADLLLKKQSQGVQVNLIYDYIGSRHTPDSFFKRLQDGGVNVLVFGPYHKTGSKRSHISLGFDHRKVLVVDGNLAITGGTNISEGYALDIDDYKSGQVELPWRDTDVQIEGPAVAQIQKIFLDNWQLHEGPQLSQRNYFPKLEKQGDALVGIVTSSYGKNKGMTFLMYDSAVTFASRSIHITVGYFVPDEQMLNALSDAARRGVDVKIILPATSDIHAALYASQYNYSRLMEAGVKLYKRRSVILHAKTAVIDGVWSTIGTSNLDYWSFLNDDELNAVILDRDFANEMETLFEDDLKRSNEITYDEWEKRSFSTRFHEWFAHIFKYWL